MKNFVVIAIVLHLLSCNNEKDDKIKSAEPVAEQIIEDSLDTSNAPFEVSNFPDSVRKLLYERNDSSWKFVYNSLLPNPKTAVFPNKLFIDTLLKHQFSIDTTDNNFLAYKKQFNSRQIIEFELPKADSISVNNQLWHDGKKYILVTVMWNNSFRAYKKYH